MKYLPDFVYLFRSYLPSTFEVIRKSRQILHDILLLNFFGSLSPLKIGQEL